MPGFLYNVGATAICPHGGQVVAIPSSPMVLLSGMPAITMADQCIVGGCAFMIGPAPHPCVKVQWLVPATRVLINGQPAIIQTSVGMALGPDGAPQGPPTVIVTQPRVLAT